MSLPALQAARVGFSILRHKLAGRRRCPLVLMLEPLFQCNLRCPGCGKVAHPPDVLARRMPLEEALGAVDACGAPVVTITGGEPLLYEPAPDLAAATLKRGRIVYFCTNGLLLPDRLGEFAPSNSFTFSVHLDGLHEQHDAAVGRDGVFDGAVEAIRAARNRGFRVTVNCTLYAGEAPERAAALFDYATELGVSGITLSPAYNYRGAERQDVFLSRDESQALFRELMALGRSRKRPWRFNQSALFLDFLAGNRTYDCAPWSMPTYNAFGWQRPCYLLDEGGYAASYDAWMRETDWDAYGPAKHPACANCMAHCGFEGAAVDDAFAHPLKALRVALARWR
jgi:hopanoid biosynthesis associated radical SAM protein HpnH